MACKTDCGCGKPATTPSPEPPHAGPALHQTGAAPRRSLPVLKAGAVRRGLPTLEASGSAPGGPAFTPTSGDLPAPIPWLGVVGEVAPLDTTTTRGALGVGVLRGAIEAAGPDGATRAGQARADVLSHAPEAQQEAARLQEEMRRRAEARMGALCEDLGLMGAATASAPDRKSVV